MAEKRRVVCPHCDTVNAVPADRPAEAAKCGHPTLNTTDLTQSAEAPSAAVPLGDQYATRHNPFMYFHSIIDSPNCGNTPPQPAPWTVGKVLYAH